MSFLLDTPPDYRNSAALVSGRRTTSYRTLARDAEKAARQLVTAGIQPGGFVALKGYPTPEVITALHGIWMTGAVAVPMNPRWSGAEEGKALDLLHASAVLVARGEDPPEKASGASPVFTLEARDRGEIPSLGSLWPDTSPLEGPAGSSRPSGVAVRLLTSGTSGSPSIVDLTFGNLAASASGAAERLNLHPSDRWLASLSLASVGGVAMVTRAALLGSALVLAGRFSAETFRDLVRDGRVTHASLVPTMLRQFMEIQGEDPALRTLRCLLIGGARAEEGLIEEAMKRRIPVALTYGMTEAASQVATAPPALVARKPGTVGLPLRGVEITVSPEDEILVRGDTVAPGKAGVDGWYATGDLGRLDPEGHLWITGRISSRIISGGVNVDPLEVEAFLRTHPKVLEAAVVGVPDPRWGERVVAALATDGSGAGIPEELDRLARAALSPAKRPGAYVLVRDLPRNPNGKLDREEVKRLFR